MSIGAEVSKTDERLATGVLDLDAAGGRIVADEDFVLGVLAKADHGWGLQSEFADATLALYCRPTAGSTVFENGLGTGLESELFGAKELLAIDASIDDPLVGHSCGTLGRIDNRLDIVGVFKVGVDVLVPVELADDEIKILMLVLGHIFDE